MGLYRYLPRFGWEPTVLTVETDHADVSERVVRSRFIDISRLVKKILGLDPEQTITAQIGIQMQEGREESGRWKRSAYKLLRDILTFPDDRYIGWYWDCRKRALQLLEDGEFRAVISMSCPNTPHFVAHYLKRRNPYLIWIADLRDLWSQSSHYPFIRLRYLLDRLLEKRTLSIADAITTVSAPLAERQKRLRLPCDVVSIPNGYDPLDFRLTKVAPPTDKLVITYTGTIYQGYRDPTPLFHAVGELISNGYIDPTKIEIRFYGPNCTSSWMRREVQRCGIMGCTTLSNSIPRREALAKQMESSLLLLLDWNDPSELGVYTGKLFEYLGAHRPILAIGGSRDGVVAQLLRETGAGIHVNDPDQLRRILFDFYNQQIQTGSVPYLGRPEKVAQYSHIEMARRFARLLDRYDTSYK